MAHTDSGLLCYERHPSVTIPRARTVVSWVDWRLGMSPGDHFLTFHYQILSLVPNCSYSGGRVFVFSPLYLFWLCWLLVVAHGILRDPSLWHVDSSCGARSLKCEGSVVVACGILVLWAGIKPLSPALQGRFLNYWIIREVLGTMFLFYFHLFLLVGG